MSETYLVGLCNIDSVIFCFHNLFPSFPLCFEPICSQISTQNNITVCPNLNTSVTSLNLPSFCFQLKHLFIHGRMCLPQRSKQRSRAARGVKPSFSLYMLWGLNLGSSFAAPEGPYSLLHFIRHLCLL